MDMIRPWDSNQEDYDLDFGRVGNACNESWQALLPRCEVNCSEWVCSAPHQPCSMVLLLLLLTILSYFDFTFVLFVTFSFFCLHFSMYFVLRVFFFFCKNHYVLEWLFWSNSQISWLESLTFIFIMLISPSKLFLLFYILFSSYFLLCSIVLVLSYKQFIDTIIWILCLPSLSSSFPPSLPCFVLPCLLLSFLPSFYF